MIREILLWISIAIQVPSYVFSEDTDCVRSLPGRKNSPEISFVQFGSTDVFFYMTPEKYVLAEEMVKGINREKLKLTVDVNEYDCLTTEISALASKYPMPVGQKRSVPVFADPEGHVFLETYAQALHQLMQDSLGLHLEGVSREINFVLSQDAHKYHQDQSANQFAFLNQCGGDTSSYKIIQDLTLIDWDMSADTLSATILQDDLSDERFLLTLFPKETVGMLFTQSPAYLTRKAHPSYSVPTIFPYHAVLSPIDTSGGKTPGSSKGKRLSTVLRGVVLEDEMEHLKEKAIQLPINRPDAFEDDRGTGFIYPNGIVARDISGEVKACWKNLSLEEGWCYKYPDVDHLHVFGFSSPDVGDMCEAIARQFGIPSESVSSCFFIRLEKKDAGFSKLDLADLSINPNSEIVLLNSSVVGDRHSYFNLAQDFTPQGLPWIQLYHFPPHKIFWIPIEVFSQLSLTPIEEILFRKPEIDSMRNDGITASDKIVTKIDLVVFEKKQGS